MKTMFLVLAALLILDVSSAQAEPRREYNFRNPPTKTKKEFVEWVGTLGNADQELTITRKDTGETFTIVDSPELAAADAESDKTLLVEIRGEKTPRFLFWGGDVIVHTFKVLDRLEAKTSGPASDQIR